MLITGGVDHEADGSDDDGPDDYVVSCHVLPLGA